MGHPHVVTRLAAADNTIFANRIHAGRNILVTSETLRLWANPTLSGSAMWG